MISVVIITKNEEKNIIDCLESVSWADEILIIDDFSEDRTLEVAQSLDLKNLKSLRSRLSDDFSKQRNLGLLKAKYDWILFLDADERVTPELREEINTVLIEEKQKPKHAGFYIQRKDVLWGKLLEHGETGNIKLLRLGKKNNGIWKGNVHEVWDMKGNVSELDSHILHYPHPTVSEFLREINFYTSLRANELYKNGIKVKWYDIIIYPKAKFIKNFFLKLGFLDGMEGLVFALFMSFHSFLVRGKLWQLWQK